LTPEEYSKNKFNKYYQ